MGWHRTDDTAWGHPKFRAGCRSEFDVTVLYGTAQRLWGYAAQYRTDGAIPAMIVKQLTTKRTRERLTAVTVGAPLFHTAGQSCRCLAGRSWPAGAEWVAHDYLEYNPSREEGDVARAKRGELKDPELRRLVRQRDGDRCRYCATAVRWSDRRSGRGGVLDHVDPTIAGGVTNLVVACRSCNGRKGPRTPAAAGLALLPVPGDTVIDPGSTTRGSVRPDVLAELEHGDDDLNPDLESDPDAFTDPGTVAAGRDGTGIETQTPVATRAAGQVGPPSTPRSSSSPNPYLRAAITGPQPDDFAGLPQPDIPDEGAVLAEAAQWWPS